MGLTTAIFLYLLVAMIGGLVDRWYVTRKVRQ